MVSLLMAQKKRQAEREGGQFLILSPGEGSAAALSALPSEVSSVGKDNGLFANGQKPRGKVQATASKIDNKYMVLIMTSP